MFIMNILANFQAEVILFHETVLSILKHFKFSFQQTFNMDFYDRNLINLYKKLTYFWCNCKLGLVLFKV